MTQCPACNPGYLTRCSLRSCLPAQLCFANKSTAVHRHQPSPLRAECLFSRNEFPLELINVPEIFLKPDLSFPCVQEEREWDPRETRGAKGPNNATQVGESLIGCLVPLRCLQAAVGRCCTVHHCFSALPPPGHGKPGCPQPHTPPCTVR